MSPLNFCFVGVVDSRCGSPCAEAVAGLLLLASLSASLSTPPWASWEQPRNVAADVARVVVSAVLNDAVRRTNSFDGDENEYVEKNRRRSSRRKYVVEK